MVEVVRPSSLTEKAGVLVKFDGIEKCVGTAFVLYYIRFSAHRIVLSVIGTRSTASKRKLTPISSVSAMVRCVRGEMSMSIEIGIPN
jgi:hypothetical protein